MEALLHQGFVKSVGVLVGGTAFAQALTVLVLPLLTRLYTPEDFSILAVYTAILGIVTVAACLRLEIAIPLPEHDRDAANLLALALSSSALVGVLLVVVVWLFPGQIVLLVCQPKLRPYLWLLPVGVWLGSSYATLQSWATRKKRFSEVARTRMTQAVSGSGLQVALGWAAMAPLGLLVGHMISSGAGIFGLMLDIIKKDHASLHSINRHDMWKMFHRFDRFPKYSTFDSLANGFGMQLPIIVIAASTIGAEAGFLLLAIRTMQAPMGLIGGAVAQVYLSRAPEELRSGNLGHFSGEVLRGLTKTGVGPLLFVGIVAPAVFSLLFGVRWARAGELVLWMTPWFIFQFIASPISMIMHVRNQQATMLVITSFGLFLRLGSMLLANHYDQNHFSEYYAVSCAIFYAVCFLIFSRTASVSRKTIINIGKESAPFLVGWTVCGGILRLALNYINL